MNRPLRDSQRAFLRAYTDPSAPTYLNGKASYQVSHPNAAPNTAQVNASVQYLHNPRIRSEIERILEEQGATPEKSTRALSAIIDGDAESESVQYGKDGELISRTVSKPRASDRIKAIDLRFKVSGHYARERAKAEAEAEIAKEEYAKLLRDTGLDRA